MAQINACRYFCDRCRARPDFNYDQAYEEAEAAEAEEDDTAEAEEDLMGEGVENIPIPAAQAPQATAPSSGVDPVLLLEFHCADVNKLGLPALRQQLVARKLLLVVRCAQDKKKDGVKLLVNLLRLPKRRPKAKKLQKDQTVLNVSRGDKYSEPPHGCVGSRCLCSGGNHLRKSAGNCARPLSIS